MYSEKQDRYYIGQTSDLEKRFARHSKGYVPSTKGYLPLALVYWEAHESRASAVRRERTLKSWKSKKRLAALAEGFDGRGQ